MAFGCAGSSPAFRTNSENEKPRSRGFFDGLTIPGKFAHCSKGQGVQSDNEPLDAHTNNAQTAH